MSITKEETKHIIARATEAALEFIEDYPSDRPSGAFIADAWLGDSEWFVDLDYEAAGEIWIDAFVRMVEELG